MKFVDVHIHLSDPEYNQKVDEIIEDARRSNVVALVSNSMNLQSAYYISEGPPSVYSARIQEIIRRTPITNLLTETDGPVHFWGPFTGKMTTPSFIPSVVKAIAEVKGTEETDIADQILRNFSNFFKIPLDLNRIAFLCAVET